MDQRLLRLYNRELQHLRETGGEFARAFPKIAGRLGMDGIECADPYVERLLEGFSFLAARVQLKIEAEFPRFTQHLFETIYPHFLNPTPSMAMIQFMPGLTEGALGEGPAIPRRSILRSELGEGDQTRCIYTTAHEVRLWPLEIVEASYHTRDLSSLGLTESAAARAAIRIRLRSTAGLQLNELPLDELVLHLPGRGATAMRLYEQLFAHVQRVVLHSVARPPAWRHVLGPSSVKQVGFTEDEALLPFGPRSFQGYRLLQEYMAFPERFMFAAIGGMQPALRRSDGDVADLTFLLSEEDVQLENAVHADNFALFCTPAVNTFQKRLERIHLADRFSEFHVVSDRMSPLDYEVHSVTSVTGYGTRGQSDEQRFRSFYACRDGTGAEDECYYALHRVPRMLSERERKGRRRSTSYTGSELYISLVDANAAPYHPDLRQLGITALCTNRDLPIHMAVGQGRTDFTLDAGAPVESIRCLGSPTTPCASRAEGQFAWQLVSHLSPNYLSLSDTDGGSAAAALREMVGLYAETARPEVRKQIEGIRTVASRPVIRRVGGAGPASFARGLEVTITLDEEEFEGSGVFLFGAVLDRFFARYVAINAFTESIVRSPQRGEVKRWPARMGLRQNL